MKATFLAIRSIGVEFANRIFYPIVIAATILAAILVGLALWLTTFSEWWWLLFFPIVIALCVAFGVLTVVKLTIRSVTPDQTKAQKQASKQFVDKLQRLAEVTGTPKIVLLFRIVRDIAAPREDGFITSLATDTLSVKRDFTAIQQSFKK